LLDDQVLDVFFANPLSRQIVPASEFALKAQSIDDGGDAIQLGHAIARVFFSHAGNGADSLGDGFWLADAACLDDDIVETSHLQDVGQLFHQIHLQRAADAPVLQGDEAVVFFPYHAPLLDQVGIDVHFADIVDDDCEFDAFFVGQNAIDQCGFTAA